MICKPVAQRPKSVRRQPRGMKVVRCAVGEVSNKTTPSYVEFAEKVNGRAAQQGFVWGAVNEAYTGHDVKEQLFSVAKDGHVDLMTGDILNVAIVLAAVTLGTAITTIIPNEELEEKSRSLAPNFTDEAEVLNGRLAMLGFVALALLY